MTEFSAVWAYIPRKGLERRLYELARKHCGRQPKWKVKLETLHKKSGSTSPLKKFRMNIKQIAKTGHLPDYLVAYDEEHDQVIFYNRGPRGHQEQIKEILQRDLF